MAVQISRKIADAKLTELTYNVNVAAKRPRLKQIQGKFIVCGLQVLTSLQGTLLYKIEL